MESKQGKEGREGKRKKEIRSKRSKNKQTAFRLNEARKQIHESGNTSKHTKTQTQASTKAFLKYYLFSVDNISRHRGYFTPQKGGKNRQTVGVTQSLPQLFFTDLT